MIRLTLSQMRRSVGRLTAAGIAIVVATAFVTATLLGGNLITATTERAVTASLGEADVILRPQDAPVGSDVVENLSGLAETDVAEGTVQVFGQISAGGERDAGMLSPVPGDPALNPYEMARGETPGPGEVAVTEATAERLGLEPGASVTVAVDVPDGDAWSTQERELTVSGIVVDPPAIVAPVGTVLLDRSVAEELAAASRGGAVTYDSVLLVAAPGVAPDDLADAVRAQVPTGEVRTADEEAAARTAELTGSTAMLVGLVLAFAAVAVFVAGIVIANTFQVLVAQRRHTLALLRCVGATRAQVRRSVLTEAVLLGVIASVVGIAAGLGLGQAALWFLGSADLGIPVPSVITPDVATFLTPLLTGVAVTVLSALAPARAATRVAPVSALRPADDPATRAGGGRLRRGIATVLAVFGAALLAGAIAVALITQSDSTVLLALGVGVLGGMVSFAGVLVGAVFVVPRAVRAAGAVWARLARRSRPTVRLAAANARRNPRRTSATASALLIGVALVTMMATGAGSARASLNATLDSYFPVDVMVSGDGMEITHEQIRAVAESEDVVRAVALPSTTATVAGPSGSVDTAVSAMDPREREVLRDEDLFPEFGGGVVVVGEDLAGRIGVADGETVSVEGPTGQMRGTAAVLPGGGSTVVLDRTAMTDVDREALVTDVWAKLADDASAGQAVGTIQDNLAEATTSGSVPFANAAAAEREGYDQIIDTLLGVVLGLLGVAVVIAVIGVANTLSLSVIERRHEHALLRAVGMTRGQLRGTLVVEGVLVALVGTALGVVLGLLYGWAASAIVFGGGGGEVHLVVPWPYVATCVVGSVVAGVAASVLPARSAAKTPPVAALAA